PVRRRRSWLSDSRGRRRCHGGGRGGAKGGLPPRRAGGGRGEKPAPAAPTFSLAAAGPGAQKQADAAVMREASGPLSRKRKRGGPPPPPGRRGAKPPRLHQPTATAPGSAAGPVTAWRSPMSLFSRRLFTAAALATALAPLGANAADKPKEIVIDWATYNPVSMLLKDKGLLEKEFAKDGIGVRWVQTLGSNKALEFLSAGSIDFGSSAGAAALVAKINGNPIKSIYVYSRPEWTALVTRKDTPINKVADLKGKRVAVTRGTDPHIFLVRAL